MVRLVQAWLSSIIPLSNLQPTFVNHYPKVHHNRASSSWSSSIVELPKVTSSASRSSSLSWVHLCPEVTTWDYQSEVTEVLHAFPSESFMWIFSEVDLGVPSRYINFFALNQGNKNNIGWYYTTNGRKGFARADLRELELQHTVETGDLWPHRGNEIRGLNPDKLNDFHRINGSVEMTWPLDGTVSFYLLLWRCKCWSLAFPTSVGFSVWPCPSASHSNQAIPSETVDICKCVSSLLWINWKAPFWKK